MCKVICLPLGGIQSRFYPLTVYNLVEHRHKHVDAQINDHMTKEPKNGWSSELNDLAE